MKSFTHTLATVAATIVMSATLVTAAVGPAQAGGGTAAVASATRFVA